MFVILVYDVKVKRLSKVRKIAEKYLQPVQKSVFEGVITDRALARLKAELERAIDCDADSVLIYKQGFNEKLVKYQLGIRQGLEGPVL